MLNADSYEAEKLNDTINTVDSSLLDTRDIKLDFMAASMVPWIAFALVCFL